MGTVAAPIIFPVAFCASYVVTLKTSFPGGASMESVHETCAPIDEQFGCVGPILIVFEIDEGGDMPFELKTETLTDCVDGETNFAPRFVLCVR